MLTVTSNSTPTFAPPKLHTSQKSSSLYCYTVYINTAHPDQSISMQFYILNFLPVTAGYYRFLPVFPLSWPKYFLPWQIPNSGLTWSNSGKMGRINKSRVCACVDAVSESLFQCCCHCSACVQPIYVLLWPPVAIKQCASPYVLLLFLSFLFSARSPRSLARSPRNFATWSEMCAI